jgi:predicted DNA-binding protein (MmcQ/YjbR family)
MTYDDYCRICRALPGATEDVKWGADLVFSVGGKMFAASGMGAAEFEPFSFKCSPEAFAELTEREGVIPAPYLARAQWVQVQEPLALSVEEAERYIGESYRLVLAKLPKRVQAELLGTASAQSS